MEPLPEIDRSIGHLQGGAATTIEAIGALKRFLTRGP
jgi:hypothetical protein